MSGKDWKSEGGASEDDKVSSFLVVKTTPEAGSATAPGTWEGKDPLPDSNERIDTLKRELHLVTKLRRTFAATLYMMNAAHDDLVALGERLDRLTIASRQCRESLIEARKKDECQRQKQQ